MFVWKVATQEKTTRPHDAPDFRQILDFIAPRFSNMLKNSNRNDCIERIIRKGKANRFGHRALLKMILPMDNIAKVKIIKRVAGYFMAGSSEKRGCMSITRAPVQNVGVGRYIFAELIIEGNILTTCIDGTEV